MIGMRFMDQMTRAVEQTQAQLNKLVETVGELTAAVQVEAAKRQDLERRVGDLATERQQQQQQSSNARLDLRTSAQVAAISGAISLLVGEILRNWH